MKNVHFILLRHAKNVKELGSTLPQPELVRAQEAGAKVCRESDVSDITKVSYSPLPRAIQTAFAFVQGFEAVVLPELLPAMPEFGSDTLFAEMTAPANFREVAKVKGNYKALYDCHPAEKVAAWQGDMIAGFDKLFNEADDGDVVLLTIHSPSVEMTLDGLMQRQGNKLDEQYLKIAELDAVEVEAKQEEDGSQITINIIRMISAPPVEQAMAQK